MKSFLNHLQEADKKQDVPPLLVRPEQEDPTKTAHTVSTTRRKILADAGMNQPYLDALAQRRLEHPEIARTFYLPSITRKDLDRDITVKYGPRGSYPSDNNPKIPDTAGGWSEGPNTVRIVKPEWNPIRNFLAHETTHALQDPEVFQRVNANIRVAGPMPGDDKDDEQDKKDKNYLYNKAEPAARANEFKTRYAQETGTPLSPNATQKDIEKFTDWMWKFSGGKEGDVISDIHFYSTPEGSELLRQAKNEKKPENDERLAESILINTVMKSFMQYLSETAAWTRKEGKDPKGGLNKKGVESYRRENPGSKLQTAVTEDPKKLKKGSKKAKRRKSFCKRMKGMKAKLTSAETARDPDSRINKSLRKWNC